MRRRIAVLTAVAADSNSGAHVQDGWRAVFDAVARAGAHVCEHVVRRDMRVIDALVTTSCYADDDGDRVVPERLCDSGGALPALVSLAAWRRKRVMLADMDGTVIENETLDEVARLAGVTDAVRSITEAAMAGALDFGASLRARVQLLRGCPAALFDRVRGALTVRPHAATLVRCMRADAGATCTLCTSGFDVVARPVGASLGFDRVLCNELQVASDSTVAGTVAEPIFDGAAKLAALRDACGALGVPLELSLCLGDGANDVPMLSHAGLSVAVFGKPVAERVAHGCIRFTDLRAALYFQGLDDDA